MAKKNKKTKIFKKYAYWIGLIGGSLGILLTAYTLYNELKPPKHVLEIYVPKVELNNSEITLSMIFDNSGDYNEVATGFGYYFVENYGISGEENYILVAEYNDIFMIGKKTSLRKVFESNIDLNSENFNGLIKTNTSYTMIMYYQFLSRENTFTYTKLPIGQIVLSLDNLGDSLSGKIQMISSFSNVDFTNQKPVLTITSYPRSTMYDSPQFRDKD